MYSTAGEGVAKFGGVGDGVKHRRWAGRCFNTSGKPRLRRGVSEASDCMPAGVAARKSSPDVVVPDPEKSTEGERAPTCCKLNLGELGGGGGQKKKRAPPSPPPHRSCLCVHAGRHVGMWARCPHPRLLWPRPSPPPCAVVSVGAFSPWELARVARTPCSCHSCQLFLHLSTYGVVHLGRDKKKASRVCKSHLVLAVAQLGLAPVQTKPSAGRSRGRAEMRPLSVWRKALAPRRAFA